MPSITDCVRCQSPLDLSGVDIVPPRSKDRGKGKSSAGAGSVAATLKARKFGFFGVVVPGLGLYRDGSNAIGRALFLCWVVALLMAIFYMGTSLATFLVVAAIAVHSTSVMTYYAYRLLTVSIGKRLVLGIVLFLFLRFIVYGGVVSASRHAVVPLELKNFSANAADVTIIKEGDVVLYPGSRLRPESFELGNIVVYRVAGGFGTDRIIGLPGELMEFKDGELFIDGVPAEESRLPVGKLSKKINFRVRLSADEYGIFPSLLKVWITFYNNDEVLNTNLTQWVKVREKDVLGPVLWRVRPIKRFGEVNR